MTEKSNVVSVVPARDASSQQQVVSIKERTTPELVIGLVGPIGAGVSTATELLKSSLVDLFDYKNVTIVKVSDLIKKSAHLVGADASIPSEHVARIEALQNIGNKLREKYGNEYLAEKVVERISESRDEGGFDRESEVHMPLRLRHAHIVDSLKNPEEAQLLRKVYGEAFWLFGVFAPRHKRQTRLSQVAEDSKKLDEILNRDEKEQSLFGQNVTDTMDQADFFVRNDRDNQDTLKDTITRFLDIIFGVGVNTPTSHEAAMFNAASAAAKSACLSRRVGATIYSETGELIGIGWNDVPKPTGGLYGTDDNQEDNRCFKWKNQICHNDDRKRKLYKSISKALRDGKIIESKVAEGRIIEVLQSTDIRNLIEFSRSVHAEMEAIVSVARANKASTRNSVMYCTTFPCHSCARHIIASGIRTVFYIEPYPKSLAHELHGDALENEDKSEGGDQRKTRFLQYEGVAPRNMEKLFRTSRLRKNKEGKAIEYSRAKAEPVVSAVLDSFPTIEQLVVGGLATKEAIGERSNSGA